MTVIKIDDNIDVEFAALDQVIVVVIARDCQQILRMSVRFRPLLCSLPVRNTRSLCPHLSPSTATLCWILVLGAEVAADRNPEVSIVIMCWAGWTADWRGLFVCLWEGLASTTNTNNHQPAAHLITL